ncbi:MAG: discoidin domain-containing protein, partial [Candidatus Omnitrophica bacterium]|nr:discoidin domain-containing protein [Candidatus Omnitrophota bacterium]
MKYLTLGLLFLFCTMSNICCAQDSLVRDVISEEVYLTVETVTVSSFDGTADWAPPPEFKAVIDGDLLSRWSSNYTDNQWICFDFGTPKVLSKVVIFWEAAYAVDYDILYSLDNQNWQTILSLKNQDGSIDEIEFRPIEARFIKLLGKKRFNPDWGISVWETVFLGPDKDNPQERPLSEVYPRLASQLAGEEPQAEEISEKPVDSPGVLTPEEFQKGVVYTSWSKTELGAEASDQTLEHLKELGVRNLGIMIVWFQDTIEEKTIYADSRDTPEDKALLHAINKAHSLGMKVMLKPHVDVKTDQWRGDIIPSQDWFAAYKNYITYYARLAAQYNVEVFSIGT